MSTSNITGLNYPPLNGRELAPIRTDGEADNQATAVGGVDSLELATPMTVTAGLDLQSIGRSARGSDAPLPMGPREEGEMPIEVPAIIPLSEGERLYAFAIENWQDPRKMDSLCQDAKDVLWSLGSTLKGCMRWVAGKICPCLPRGDGDGLKTIKEQSLCNLGEEGKSIFNALETCALNQLEVLYPNTDYHPQLKLPDHTENFVLQGENVNLLSDDPMVETFELRLQLVPILQGAAGVTATQQHLDSIASVLSARGFVACRQRQSGSGGPLLILNPRTHLCAALLYDRGLGKICIHFRDTAGSGLWEKGTKSANWSANFAQGMGLVPEIYRDADLLAYSMRAAFGSEKLLLVGYSLGGGLTSFAALRYLIPALAINSAAPSPCHQRFFANGWEDFAAANISYLSLDRDILSRVLDDPYTGGILPTKYPKGAKAYLFNDMVVAPESKSYLCGLIKRQVQAHSIVELLLSMRRFVVVCAWKNLVDYEADCLDRIYEDRVTGRDRQPIERASGRRGQGNPVPASAI